VIREDHKQTFVENLRHEPILSTAEAMQLLQAGIKNRTTGATAANAESSRSHSVFTIYLQSKVQRIFKSNELQEEKKGVTHIKTSRLNLIDLAGSERQSHTEATGQRLKEAGNINKSLSFLGNVIRALIEGSLFIPYRNSKLTHLLQVYQSPISNLFQDSLGGNAKTMIIATLSPASYSFGESLSTLLFAQRAKLVKNKAFVNEDTTGKYYYFQRFLIIFIVFLNSKMK
jgi:kinesin family protein 15